LVIGMHQRNMWQKFGYPTKVTVIGQSNFRDCGKNKCSFNGACDIDHAAGFVG